MDLIIAIIIALIVAIVTFIIAYSLIRLTIYSSYILSILFMWLTLNIIYPVHLIASMAEINFPIIVYISLQLIFFISVIIYVFLKALSDFRDLRCQYSIIENDR